MRKKEGNQFCSGDKKEYSFGKTSVSLIKSVSDLIQAGVKDIEDIENPNDTLICLDVYICVYVCIYTDTFNIYMWRNIHPYNPIYVVYLIH